jgi:hypothetical protein
MGDWVVSRETYQQKSRQILAAFLLGLKGLLSAGPPSLLPGQR